MGHRGRSNRSMGTAFHSCDSAVSRLPRQNRHLGAARSPRSTDRERQRPNTARCGKMGDAAVVADVRSALATTPRHAQIQTLGKHADVS
jgi:hypothetical protein